MLKVSIVVPVYKVEKYLSKCIESILNQTYEKIELILVNDGSPDESDKICKKYFYDKRVKYIKKENGGVSSARNIGIENATGEYLVFVDSDDWIEEQMIEEMVKELNDNQIPFCGYTEQYLNTSTPIKLGSKTYLAKTEIIDSLFRYKSVSGFLWNKIYDMNIIKNNKIRFDENIKYCEDLLFNIEYLLNIEKVTILPKCLYNYRMRKSGVTWEKNKKKLMTISESYTKIEKILNSQKINSIEFIYNKLNLQYRLNSRKVNLQYKKEYKKIMKSNEISLKRKIKLFVLKNFKEIHTFYMKQKVSTYKLYD